MTPSDYSVADFLAKLPRPEIRPLSAAPYTGDNPGVAVGLAVESMRRHTSPEGWEQFLGLQHAGYVLHGHNIGPGLTDVREILARESPGVVLLQDKREWMGETADRSRDPAMRFANVGILKDRPDVWTGTVLKDAHQQPTYHRESADEIGCHFWVGYYHPRIVCHLAPFVRPAHLVRTYHCVDPRMVPPFSAENRKGTLLSGAISAAYPLRQRLRENMDLLPRGTTYLRHPGYRADGCRTPEFLRTLARHKVAVCTASRYGYLLKKLVEATACGCIVLTDLPVDEVLPAIDGNLVRVHPDWPVSRIADVIADAVSSYDPQRQAFFADASKRHYDYHAVGLRLAADIEALRRSYRP